jgi:superfamily II DNA/RNA helicase
LVLQNLPPFKSGRLLAALLAGADVLVEAQTGTGKSCCVCFTNFKIRLDLNSDSPEGADLTPTQ